MGLARTCQARLNDATTAIQTALSTAAAATAACPSVQPTEAAGLNLFFMNWS
jgi:hypothetical protein